LSTRRRQLSRRTTGATETAPPYEGVLMFLARRDLVAAKGRFLLMGTVVALIAMLGVLLAGLAAGLVEAGTSGLESLDFTDLAFQPGAESTFSRSFLEPSTVQDLAAVPGTSATPLGVSLFNARHDSADSVATTDDVVDVALFGVEPAGFLAPDVSTGDGLATSGGDGVVISRQLADDGVAVGDTLTLGLDERELRVVGVTDGGTYGPGRTSPPAPGRRTAPGWSRRSPSACPGGPTGQRWSGPSPRWRSSPSRSPSTGHRATWPRCPR
jgi:hypothetical protein